jgi:formimidoylglutamate deiminase
MYILNSAAALPSSGFAGGMRMTSLFFSEALLEGGWARDVRIACSGGRIAALETGVAPRPGDERHAIGLPGLPNLHSHAFQRGMAGLSEVRGPAQDSFWTWREVMYRFLATMTPEDVQAVSAQAYVEMLEAGFTRVGEFHYLHNDTQGRPYADPAELAGRVAAASVQAGIGLTLLPVFYAHGQFGGAPPAEGQRRFVTDPGRFARLLESCRAQLADIPGSMLGVAPHSLRAVTEAELADVLALSPDGPVHIHVAEQLREVEDCLAHTGARPVEWLLDHAPVDGRWCLVHATHMTAQETARMARSGAVAGLCPVTEANLGDGVFNGPDFLAAGGRFGVGTDSNVAIDAAQELRQLEYSQRLHRRGRNLMAGEQGQSTGRALFDAALHGGSAALGAPVGLRGGAPADLVALDASAPALLHRSGDALLDGWVFAGTSRGVDSVWVAGRKMVARGRHVAREAVAADYARALQRLLAG